MASDRRASDRSTAFRSDLQGLRGVAVLGVVVYHLRASWLPGGFAGVDVFFVLSGFFISGLLLREIQRSGTVDLRAFWARRARRLLPASMLVVLATLVASYCVLDPLEARRVSRDGLFATVFGMNWREAASGVAYGADPNPSPFQHFWSLGVEEQFYVGWPLVLVLLAVLWRVAPALPPRVTLTAVAVIAGTVSFVIALGETGTDQPYAYYGTAGRVWQLAVGGLLACAPAALQRWPRWLRSVSRVVGVGLVVGFYVAAPAVGRYPGWWSLVPTLGAAAVVLAGEPVLRHEPVGRLLGSRLGQLGGRYSYSWYLWHWAPLVLLPVALGRPLRIRELGACATATLLLAVLTYHLLEDPVRRSRFLARGHGGWSLQLGALLLVAGTAVSLASYARATQDSEHTHIAAAGHHVLRPQPLAAAREVPFASTIGCQLPTEVAGNAGGCRLLPDTGHGDIILVGDSHAAMWAAALRTAATDHGWGYRVWTRVSCPFADVHKSVTGNGEYVNCDVWRADLMDRLIAAKPSLVVVSSYAQINLHVTDPRTGRGAPQPVAHALFRAGLEHNLGRLRKAGIKVLLIADPPGYLQPAPNCALQNPHDLARCSLPRAEALVDGGVDDAAARSVPGVRVVDFADTFCGPSRCYQVVHGVLAYRDENHLTEEMAMVLEPALARAVVTAQG